MKKSILAGLLSTSLLLAACGDTEQAPEEEAANEETTEQTTEDTGTEEEEEVDETSEDTSEEAEDDTEEEAGEEAGATIKTSYTAPHGDQAFASTFVVMDGDTITHAMIDEYQFMEDGEVEGVPNSDAAFGDGSAEGQTLISKLNNDEQYSEMMSEAGSTVSYADNLMAITDFVEGQTVSEIEDAIAELDGQSEDDEVADVVSGATLVDTGGYLQAIVDTANEGFEYVGVEDADFENAELSYSLQAPHGDQAFAPVAVLHDGDTVLAAAMDEFQYVDPAEFEGVPNSDATFGEAYNEDVVLASKMENDDAYSSMMEQADATNTYAENMQAIIDHAEGATIQEIQSTIDELNGLGEDDEIADVVSGATFVDTAGYLQAIVDTLDN